ncbi:MAG: hypothetical protein QM758_27200 [Armatimonas sp.]
MERPSAKKPNQWNYSSRAGLYELCLACALEDGAPYAAKVGAFSGLEASSKSWMIAAIQNYWLAFTRAEAGDLKETSGGVGPFVSQEAGESYKRLLQARGSITRAETAQLARIATTVAKLEKSAPRYVTPIVFCLKPGVGWPNRGAAK